VKKQSLLIMMLALLLCSLVSEPIPAATCTEGDVRAVPQGICCPQGGELYLIQKCVNGQWRANPADGRIFQCAGVC
jgi:hypothetical protein